MLATAPESWNTMQFFFSSCISSRGKAGSTCKMYLWCSVCFYCLGFLQFSAMLVPGIDAQSSLDTKEKDILWDILRPKIN